MVRALNPGPLHAELAYRLLRVEGRAGNLLTTNLQIAAMAIEANVTLHTANPDFVRFSEMNRGAEMGQSGDLG
jgi:hypothetical protein